MEELTPLVETIVNVPAKRKRKFRLLSFGEAIENNYQPHRTRDLLSDLKTVIPVDVHKAILDRKDQENNAYSTSKSYSQNILNTSIMQSQIFLLVNLFDFYSGRGFEIVLAILLCMSLALQFTIFVLLVILARAKDEQLTENITATGLNALITSLTFLLLIITTAITAVSKVTSEQITNTTRLQ